MKKEEAMTDDYDPKREKRQMRAMLIFSAAIVLLILGLMGADVLWYADAPSLSTEISSQSRTAPPK